MTRAAVAVAVAIAGVARTAHADYGPEAVELDREDPPAGRVEFGFDGGAPIDTWGASIGFGLLRRPLVIQTNPGVRVPVSRRQTVSLGGALAIGERLVLDARLPLARQSGKRLIATNLDDDLPLARYVVEDLRLAARFRVVGDTRRGAFVRGSLTLPTGDEANFAGEPGAGFGLALIGRMTIEPGVVFAATAGLRLRRDEVTLGDRVIGNELTYAGGILVPVPGGLSAIAEADGAVGDRQGKTRGPAPLELRVGVLGQPFDGLTLGLRAGLGVLDEIGTPTWRMTLELAWRGDWKLFSPRPARGRDDDEEEDPE